MMFFGPAGPWGLHGLWGVMACRLPWGLRDLLRPWSLVSQGGCLVAWGLSDGPDVVPLHGCTDAEGRALVP